jgi:hypothetical protein
LAAREGGAGFLGRPVTSEEWAAVIERGLTQPAQPARENPLDRSV